MMSIGRWLILGWMVAGVQVLSAGKIGQEKGDFTFQCWPGVLKVQRIEVSGF